MKIKSTFTGRLIVLELTEEEACMVYHLAGGTTEQEHKGSGELYRRLKEELAK